MSQPNNPLHGVTLEQVVTRLVEHFGWERLGQQIRINCFQSDPSVKSSLKFLRKTPWAREKVEALYIATFAADAADSNTGAKRPKPAAPSRPARAQHSGTSQGQPFNPWLKPKP